MIKEKKVTVIMKTNRKKKKTSARWEEASDKEGNTLIDAG